MRSYHDLMCSDSEKTYGEFYHDFIISLRWSVIRRRKEMNKQAKYGTAKQFYRSMQVWKEAIEKLNEIKNRTSEYDRTR